MNNRLLTYFVAAAAMVAILCLVLVSTPAAQNAPATQNKSAKADVKPDTLPPPKLSDGHPDFSGFYNNTARYRGDFDNVESGAHVIDRTADGNIFFDYGGANVGPGLAAASESNDQPPYKPEYMAKVNAIAATMYGGNTNLDPQLDCKPMGLPRGAFSIMQIVHTPKVLAILYEAEPGPYYRVIYTDGRQHPKDFDSSYYGHSIGHWDGDTMVVDTVGLNDETWLGGDQTGRTKHTSIHSDQEHVIERWSRKGNVISWNAVVEDPVMFTKPWSVGPRKAAIADDDDYIQPQMCVGYTKGHFIEPSAKDPGLRCGWCNPESLYGGTSNDITSPVLAQQEKDRKEGKAEPKNGGGGGE
jgi:hypothetical protein